MKTAENPLLSAWNAPFGAPPLDAIEPGHFQPAFERALKYHLKIAYGLDDDPAFTTREFVALVRAGLTPLQALQAATTNAAELLQKSKDIGSLEPEHYADIIAIHDDPLKDISAVERVVFVMKGGKVIRSEP